MAQDRTGLKVFISVDMEGITGVTSPDDVSGTGRDYAYFRDLMARETNAAIEGAIRAGATEITVRDSHGSALNILPEDLHKKAKLIRGWSGGFMSMMEGLDESYDAVICVGYHARAGTPHAILEHTFSSRNLHYAHINGLPMPEIGINALIAGHYKIPLVFVSGDRAICDQSLELFGHIKTVSVKEGLGNASINIHPSTGREKIRSGVEEALSELKNYKPYTLDPPYTLEVGYKSESMANIKSFQKDVIRTGDYELTYKCDDIMDLVRVFYLMR
jgi:D-amino peptidase